MGDLDKLYKFLRKNSFYSEARYLKKVSMLPEDSGYNSLGYFLRNMRTIRDRQPRQFGELESKWTSEDNIGKIFEAVDHDELFQNRREYPFSSSAYEKLLRYYLDNGGDINFLYSIEDEKNEKEESGARTGNWPLYSAVDEIIESERAKTADTERYFGLGRHDNEYWKFHPKHIEEKLLELDPYNDKDDLSSALSIAKKFSGMDGKASASIMSIFNKNFPNIVNGRPYDPDETLEVVGPDREHLN